MSDFQTFRYRLRLTGRLRLETALRVGSGLTDELSGTDIAVVKDAQRRPYIPGSSFKGALRAHIERLVRSVESEFGSGKGACNPMRDEERCIPSKPVDSRVSIEQLRRNFENNPSGLDDELYCLSCRVCRVFGSPWLASKVLVKDLLLAEPELWFDRRYQVRHGVGIERDSETASRGLLYDYEAVPAGTEFRWEIVIENADRERAEDGLVIWGLREFANGRVRLGGGRSRGLGWVTLTFDEYAEEVDATDRQALLDYLTTGRGRLVSHDEVLARAATFARMLAGEEG
ncbi:MAG: CRISPR-associated RAMP protein [Chloroflexi bacterium]|nr:MAG: CRISPR-associated RAMP protein [Chloroflexota bacterium]